MSIQKTPAFQTSDGNTYASLEIAQRAEMLKLLTGAVGETATISEQQANEVLHRLFERLDDVKDILRCTGRKPSKAKAGRNGKRKASATTTE